MSGHAHETIGVRGNKWRTQVTNCGMLIPRDGSAPMLWRVAADDRWYVPENESTLRQKWLAGTPVAETRLHVPGGDIVQRIFCVADLGGMTVMEFVNESTLPVVIALSRNDVLTTHPPSDVAPLGIEMPSNSLVLPLGHQSSVRTALLHSNPHAGHLPDTTAGYMQVLKGWETACEVASRVVLPDQSLCSRLTAVRSKLLLDVAVNDLDTDSNAEHSVIERIRLGDFNSDSVLDVVRVVERRIKRERKSSMLSWDTAHLLTTAASVCAHHNEDAAVDDIARAWLRLADNSVEPIPDEAPEDHLLAAWLESLLAQPSASGGVVKLLPRGIPKPWWGQNFQCHRLVADARRQVSYAVRWHGALPALLWEVHGQPGLVLTAGHSGLESSSWSSTQAAGETLLEAPTAPNSVK